MKDLDDAVQTLLSHLTRREQTESLAVPDALGRVSAEPVFAKVSSPFYNASAMDGVCVQYEKTTEASEKDPLRLKKGSDFQVVDTGDVIRSPYNAVIMIEDIVEIDDDTIEIFAPCSPWQHVRSIGEDIVAAELIIPAYHMVRAVDIGAMLAGGIRHINVIKKPVVSIIPTGTEIIDYTEDIEEGRIIDSNSHMFESLGNQAGAQCIRCDVVTDDDQKIKSALKKACDSSDIVIIGAGSSAGTEDYTRRIIAEAGTVILHGVAIKPGKPVVVGQVDDTCVIGIPGYPVSAYFVFVYFVIPVIRVMLHQDTPTGQTVKASLTARVVSSLKHLEFVRVRLGDVNGRLIAAPLSRGAGVTMSLVNADGILKVPKNSEGYEAGTDVEVELVRDIGAVKNTLVSIGSHDILLDILNDQLHRRKVRTSLSSTHAGSMGGLIAFQNGQCHIAPIHLLDEATGVYNISYIKKYIRSVDYVLLRGVKRTQGIMVRKSAEDAPKTITDLAKPGAVFVNRQKGSGTRILFDYLLKQAGIDKQQISGYDREMNTHMMIASAVLSGSADAGIGVMSAARTMGLDFYPIGNEEYDFLVRKDMVGSVQLDMFIVSLQSATFQRELDALGGYCYDDIGQIVPV